MDDRQTKWERMTRREQTLAQQAEVFVDSNNVVITYGDLFDTVRKHPGSSVAHCISADAALGKGIAPLIVDAYMQSRRELGPTPLAVGMTVVTPMRDDSGGHVLHLVTKERYSDKPTYETLASALQSLVHECHTRGITRVVMPRIACGLDKLDWACVLRMIKHHFHASALEALICLQ